MCSHINLFSLLLKYTFKGHLLLLLFLLSPSLPPSLLFGTDTIVIMCTTWVVHFATDTIWLDYLLLMMLKEWQIKCIHYAMSCFMLLSVPMIFIALFFIVLIPCLSILSIPALVASLSNWSEIHERVCHSCPVLSL